MGQLKHEAAAVDPWRQVVYLTEDESDGCLYRFVPVAWRDLSGGTLEVLVQDGSALAWAPVPQPRPGLAGTPTRQQVPSALHFNGGEGACVDDKGVLFFTTKGDNRVWALNPVAMTLTVVYDDGTSPTPDLTGVDNITLNRKGVLFVAEDGGNLQIVAVGPGERAAPVVELTGVSGSEITGPAFTPDGSRLYFSSQRNPGRTYEVTGPWT
jgi:secreted PhoX family phosphatase